jgi:hypothetical protein
MSFGGDALFNLLPALYRIRDAQLAQTMNLLSAAEADELTKLKAKPAPLSPQDQARLDALTQKAGRGPLQSLMALVGEQLSAVEDNLDQLYDDQFIETCALWVIPYIGDLIGFQQTTKTTGTRAEVAHTISFRRRKGTALMLEQLARDATGFGARAVEFFKLLAWTQHMNHIRLDNAYAPDLRGSRPGVYMDTGFDATAHKVDARRISVERGRYNIQNIGIFLWSLNAYKVTRSPAAAVAGSPLCFRVSSLERDAPLFTNPLIESSEITTPAQPVNVPDRLRRHVLCEDISNIQQGAKAVYYGESDSLTNSLALYVIEPGADPTSPALLGADQIAVCDLSGSDGAWVNTPQSGSKYRLAIDPQLGRIALRPIASGEAQVVVTYHYGFNAEMGAGEYPRADTFLASPEQPVVRVSGSKAGAVKLALDQLGGEGVVEIADSGVYREATIAVTVREGGRIELRARDGCRPTLVLAAEMTVAGGANSEFDLNGLVVTTTAQPGNPSPRALIHATAAANPTQALGVLRVTHCALTPGWALNPDGSGQHAGAPAILAETAGLTVEVEKSILGPLLVHRTATANIADSIIDADSRVAVAYAAPDGVGGGGSLMIQGCTVIGKVHATLLSLASNCIFWTGLADKDTWAGPLWADRKQEGCVRFSYLPAGAVTPRQYQCKTAAIAQPGPLFQSLSYGDPAYGKLLASTSDDIRRGADDGGEMGVFHFIGAPRRESNLRIRLKEYLPVGLEYGIFYET